jgi:demethylmenaquinone methyltransferase/2-methoxy-6-polyprenyl-1,4-benzoquinol methylase
MSSEKEKINCEQVMPYGDGKAKGEQVEQMFDSISRAYDVMNTAMTFGLHKVWRNTALRQAARYYDRTSPIEILDVATGTGDVAFELNRRFPEAQVTGIDISNGMLGVAEKKLAEADESARRHISFQHGDSLDIKVGDGSYDLVTVAYGVRNFQDLLAGYKEIYRVLRPGGRLCVIELSEPENKLIRAGYRFYSRTLIPRVGSLVSGDNKAYSYLLESIAESPQRDRMTALMSEAGFRDCTWRGLTMGVVTIYWAVK